MFYWQYGPAHIDCARFYAAEIVNALEYLHSKGIVHRFVPPRRIFLETRTLPLTTVIFSGMQGPQA